MAQFRTPGPLHGGGTHGLLNDGTLQRAQGFAPGPVGMQASGWLDTPERAADLWDAVQRARPRVAPAVARATGEALDALIDGLLPGLLAMLAVLGASTVIGGAAGGAVGFLAGGVGAAPGAVAGAKAGASLGMALLNWLGLGFLIVEVARGLHTVSSQAGAALQRAWSALDRPHRMSEVDAAANALAEAVALLMQLILMAIVQRLRAGKGPDELLGQLRQSRLGAGFADWVALNAARLTRNPRLQMQRELPGGQARSAAMTPSQLRRAGPPPPPPPPPSGKGGPQRRRPSRRCELLPYEELLCPQGQHRHHVVPDWMLRIGRRDGGERIPGLPDLAQGPALCLEGGSGNAHSAAHRSSDPLAQRVARNGTSTGVPGTLRLGQAKAISARAIEKATGGAKRGGCDKADIQQQLDRQFSASNNTVVRGVQDARQVTDEIKNALRPTLPRGK